MLTPKQVTLKARLLALKKRLESYSCHGKANQDRLDRSGAYAVAAGYFDGWNPPDKDGVRYVEKLESAGLRFVAYADEIVRLNHTGWYTNEFQDSKLRGVVLQLPARHGRPVFVAGYEDPDSPAARIDSGLFIGDDSEGADAKRDAALAADSFAEREAEKEREYQEAWQAGSRYGRLGEEVAEERKKALGLFVELRKARATLQGDEFPSICATLRARIERAVESIREAREERAKLLDERPTWNKQLAGAWNEGAGI